MKQIRFGRRREVALESARAAATGDYEWLRLGMLIATGIVTGFVAAAIECL